MPDKTRIIIGTFWIFSFVILCLVALHRFLTYKKPETPITPTPTTTFISTPSPSIITPPPPIIDIFVNVPNVPDGELKYGGSTTWAPMYPKLESGIEKVKPNFKLEYIQPNNEPPGSNTGIQMLLNGELDFSLSSRELTTNEKNQGLKEIAVAIDGIAIAVNPKLNLTKEGLTLKQLKDIYTGNIKNWNEVGGPNLPIQPYSRRPSDSGTVEYFKEKVLNKESPEKNVDFVNVMFVSNTTKGVQKVNKNPGGIYFASAPEVLEQCGIKPLPIFNNDQLVPPYESPLRKGEYCQRSRNKPDLDAFRKGSYPLTRKLYVIVKQNDPNKLQAGEAYANLLLTGEGQKIIEDAGFVRIK
ncbi:MAG: phosphate ABC transporter substrate-binding protein [Gloeotrichia echinulata IR180]